MISSPELLEALDARWQREAYAHLSYDDALRRFVALYNWASEINPEFGADWEEDIEADLTLARILNGLPHSG